MPSLASPASPQASARGLRSRGRRELSAAVVLLAFAAVVFSALPATAQSANLVAAYAFSEGSGATVADASGHGHVGTIVNATWTAGKFGSALSFNGVDAKVVIADSISLRLKTGMTLAAWVKPAAPGKGWRDALAKGGDDYNLETSSVSNKKPGGGGTFAGASATVYGAGQLPSGVWSHLAVTYDGATLRMYVNGAAVASAARTGNIRSSSGALEIGGDSVFGRYFQGAIDEVHIYNSALAGAQIQALMGSAIDTQPPSAPGTLAATPAGASRIDLAWGAATDDVGVTGYLVERCAGAGCSSFAQIAATAAVTSYADTTVTPGTTYRYRVRATDAASHLGGYSNVATATTPAGGSLPPTAPGTLSAAVSGTQVNLSWGAATDDAGVTGYRVERCQGGACTGFAQIAAIGPVTAYSDPGLTAGTTYRYRVRAADAGGALGPYSNVATAAIPVGDTKAPTAPQFLRATPASASRINLTWQAATDNVGVAAYLVERCKGGSCIDFAQIASVTGTSYADLGLSPSTKYRYRVRAKDAAGNTGPYSDVASGATKAGTVSPIPTAPTSLTATALNGTQIALSWGASTDDVGVTGYLVERCVGAGCTSFAQIATMATTSYTNSGLAVGATYRYRVRATDGSGNLSPYSNIASATTASGPTGLVAAYGFNEGAGGTTADASGRGHTGAIGSATWVASGKYGKALSFNGTSARVTINDAADLRLTTGMTLEAWVNPAVAGSDWQDVIFKGDDDYFLESSSPTASLPATGATIGGSGVLLYSPGALPVNSWTHVAATFDGLVLRLYINGVEAANGVRSGDLATSATPLEIGGNSLFGQYFQGLIDEVRIYNVALTPGQIQADMNTPIAAVSDGQAPSAPGALTASGAAGDKIALSWGAATDNVGVTGYRVERCQGGGCSTFAQVAATDGTGTTYIDTNLAGAVTYRYRVRAADAAGNLGPYSNVAAAATGFVVSPRAVVLTPGQTQQFTAEAGSVTWSVDGAVGGTAGSGTITASGLYTAPAAVGTHTVTVTTVNQSQTASAAVYVSSYGGTLTHHNDNSRMGQNLFETALAPARVNAASFGKLFSYPLDGSAYASPLYVANVVIPGQGAHNVVYVATSHNSVYAFDADGRQSAPLWQTSFINPGAGVTPVPASDTGECCDIAPEIGIVSTPVIDAATDTLYVVAKTKEVGANGTRYFQRLHALDIKTGDEKFGGPVAIEASVPGIGVGSQGGMLAFDPLHHNQRAALLLSQGMVYIAFSSHGDVPPYHGWVFAYHATTLDQVFAWCATPNTDSGGIWQGGGGLTADPAGNIYFVTGDGPFDVNVGGVSYGDSFVKMSAAGQVLDFFTPHDQATLDSGNKDLGAGGLLLLPVQGGPRPNLMLEGGKNGALYLVDRDDLGQYDPNNDSGVVQSLTNIFSSNLSSPVYYKGSVYLGPVNDKVKAFGVSNGQLTVAPTSQTPESYGFPGAALAVSANLGSGGILWAVQRNGAVAPGVLRAYDAGNLGTLLYASNQAGSRDTLDFAVRYSIPLVANGKVFVGGMSKLTVYGLLP